jgi:plastocyanin
VGAESQDLARQALAFLPSEIWIHAGDSIAFTIDTEEIHSVTFLKVSPAPPQMRPPFPVGCPGFVQGTATFDGTTCISTNALASPKGTTFTVKFPKPGNFELVCLVHENMTAAVHVLDVLEDLPHDQDFYDDQATTLRNSLLWGAGHDINHSLHHSEDTVIAGSGEVSATAGGSSTLSVVRFIHAKKVIHAGETVEWDNEDPVTPHTITFGTEPDRNNLMQPSGNVTVDSDGALHAVIHSTSDNVHSGFIVAAPQERLFLPQSPLGVTRCRVTFPNPGVFPYICALHDDLGMKGTIVVVP